MRGTLFLILGPSGSGKGVTIAHLKKTFPEAVFPISCTTRQPRPGESDGAVYHFVSKMEFERRKEAGDFLEWAVVHHDNMYGTLKAPIMEALEAGKIVIREVDMQGVISIQKVLPRENVVSIFLTVATWDSLKMRIVRRHNESDEELAKREVSFKKEMEFSKSCDYVIENRDGEMEETFSKVDEIIRGRMVKT